MTEDRVLQVFVQALNVPENVDKSKLIYNEYPSWDSLGHMGLVAALENEFDCMLDMDEILDMSSYEIAVNTMKKHA